MPRKSVGKGGSSLSHRSDSSSSSGSSSGYHGSSNGNMSARNTDSEVLVFNYFPPFLREIGALKFLFSIYRPFTSARAATGAATGPARSARGSSWCCW